MKLFVTLFSVLLLAACGPRYVTDYDLYPADSVQGKQAALQCDVAKERCEKICYQRALECEKFDDYGPYGGVGGWNNGVGVGVGFPIGSPAGRSCTSTAFCEQSCREDQIACYEKSGGKAVAREPRCVSGCK